MVTERAHVNSIRSKTETKAIRLPVVLSGGSLEPSGNGWPRQMITQRHNPAYRPACNKKRNVITTFLQTVDKLGVGSYAQHHFSLIINSFFIFLKKAKNPAVFQPRFSSIFASFFKFMHAKVSPAFISIRALPVYCV